MKIFKYILLAAGILASSDMYALDFPWLSFNMKDATEISVAADNLTMSYSGGNLLLTSASVNQTLPVAEIASMTFTNHEAALDDIAATLTEKAAYYTLGGVAAGEFATADDARRALPHGVYIAKTASKSFKIIF